MPVCVIFNPRAGRGHAQRRLARFLSAWGGEATLRPSTAPGHASVLAREAVEEGFDAVAAAGGDGTVHEVANGLLAADQNDAILAIIPIGSANDYAHSLLRQFQARALDGDDDGDLVDVGLVRTANGREHFFVENLGIGLTARVTLEAQAIERQGLIRYACGAYRAIKKDVSAPELLLQWDDQPAIKTPTLTVSMLLGNREGNFPLAPAAKLDDGLFDYLHVGPMTRWQVLRMLPRLAIWGPPRRHASLQQGQCRSLQVESAQPLAIHTDGEMFCEPDDGVTQATVELLPRRLCVKVVSVKS